MTEYTKEQIDAIKELKRYKNILSKQEINTLRGQIKSGDVKGAMKGLNKLIN